jgi:DNA primase
LNSPYDAEQHLAGWQARYVGDCPDSVPKYLSCKGMKKSQLLYGLPTAVASQGAVVVCEGPTGLIPKCVMPQLL